MAKKDSNTGQFENGNRPWNTGISGYSIKYPQNRRLKGHLSEEHRKKIAASVPRGEKHSSWKGGVWPEHRAIRQSFDSRQWRAAVLSRDGHRCVDCGADNNLEADHIKPFSRFPDLRFDVNNGRTLCKDCHKKTDTYGGFSRNMRDKSRGTSL